jgi:hypothetical protein
VVWLSRIESRNTAKVTDAGVLGRLAQVVPGDISAHLMYAAVDHAGCDVNCQEVTDKAKRKSLFGRGEALYAPPSDPTRTHHICSTKSLDVQGQRPLTMPLV